MHMHAGAGMPFFNQTSAPGGISSGDVHTGLDATGIDCCICPRKEVVKSVKRAQKIALKKR